MQRLDRFCSAEQRGVRLLALAVVCLLTAGCATTPEPASPKSPPPAVPTPSGVPERAPLPPEPTPTVPSMDAAPSTGEETMPATPPSAPTKAAPAVLRISAVGDIMLGGSATSELAQRGYDYPFDALRSLLKDSHVVFGNLEGPLTQGGHPANDKQYVFRSPPKRVAPALAQAGFSVVALANNHAMDYGVEGLRETMAALANAGIQHTGAGMSIDEARAPALIDAAGYTVAFLAYSLTFPQDFWARSDRPGTAFGHEVHVRADVAAARKLADLVIVSFHWGREVTTTLRDYQPRLAHAAIDAGATMVFGHHPHILQGIERYKSGLIFYSLGNFAFGSYSRNATRSIVAQLTVEGGRIKEARLIPINVNNIEVVFQPRRLDASEANEVITRLGRLSAPLGTVISDRDGIGFVSMDGDPEQPMLSEQSN